MSVKKQILSLCKLYSLCEERPEEFLEETDVGCHLYHNIFDISQSQHRRVRVSRGSNKKLFAIKLFQFCNLKTQQRYILHEEVNTSKRELVSVVDSLSDCLKIFDHSSKCKQVPLPKPQVMIGSTKSKDNLFAHYYNDIIEHPNRQVRLSFPFGTTILAQFSSKSLNYTAINLFLQKLSTLTIAKFIISTRTDITLQTNVKGLRAITMCSAFTLDCEYDSGTVILIVDVYCPNTKCSSKLCLDKKTFQSLGRSDYQFPRCASVCQVRNFDLADQTNSFLWSFGQGVYIFE